MMFFGNGKRSLVVTFDGDESNIHIAQSQGGRIECSTICRTAFMIISAQNNAPIMGCVQNTLICMYMLTETFTTPEDPRASDDKRHQQSSVVLKREDGTTLPGYETFIDSSDFISAIEAAGISEDRFKDLLFRAKMYYPDYILGKPGELKLADRVPGKILASVVFPRNFTWSRKTEINEYLPEVKIKNGIVLPSSGPLEKKTIGGTAGSSIHALWKMSPDTAAWMISECQFISSVMISRIGFSMSISDCLPTRTNEVKAAIDEALIKCEMINNSEKDSFDKEREINGALNEAMGIAPRLAKTSMNKGDRNALVIMQRSGAKGSVANNGQISAFVGQQNIDGKRTPFMLSNGTRTLPHFRPGDNSPAARGFVRHSYLEGLDFKEAWFHAGAGRRGVIDTAMKSVTRETEILICINQDLKIVQIGDWIDNLLNENINRVEKFKERNMEYLKLDGPVKIPTTDSFGNVTWGEITAVTRHDPGDSLYKITTLGGRTVIVTASKSLLIWNKKTEKFEQTKGNMAKIDDYVPTTLVLPSPTEETVKEMNMEKFLPKDENIWGSEIQKFKKLEIVVKNGKATVPVGWWEQNNGVNFITPFNGPKSIRDIIKKKSFTPGVIKPHRSSKTRASVPEKFKFDSINGFFIGLYLAEGNSDVKSGMVCITNNDKILQDKTKEWFELYNMSYHTRTSNNAWGQSTTIRGCSTIMAKFLIEWLGKNSYEKEIPSEIFSAPDIFIKALLDGYISGDGCVTKNGEIKVSSASEKLITGVSLLCSRLGIFGKISKVYRTENNLGTKKIAPAIIFSIRSSSAFKFAQLIGCTHKEKFSKMRTTGERLNNSRPIFAEQNDVILDKIISIEEVDPKLHKYVYDLTVPSTTNFGLANGLHVVDTSDSGYIQKKCVKKEEDCKTWDDGTVRDINGIVQFLHGGDGFNAKELIPCQNLDFPFFCNPFFIANMLNSEVELSEGFATTGETDPLRRMNLEEIKMLCSFIQSGCPGVQTEVTERATFNVRTILRFIIPKVLIYESVIPRFCRSIKDEFEEAKAKHGFMAGLVSASSIGEPTTQLCVVGTDSIPVLIKINRTKTKKEEEWYYNEAIGPLIDELLEKSQILYHFGKNSVAAKPPVDMYVNTVDPITSKTAWKKVEEISRHPANGKLVKAITKSKRMITTTLAHSHLRRSENGDIVPIRGDKLKIGDFIPVCSKIHKIGSIKEITAEGQIFPLDFETGWIFGAYLSEGHVNRGQIGITNISMHFENRCRAFAKKYGGNIRVDETTGQIYNQGKFYPHKTTYISGLTNFGRYLVEVCGKGSEGKIAPAFALHAPDKFVSGLLRGYFDGDGNVNEERQLIRVASISRDLIESIALLLSRFGMFGSISIETKANRDPERNEKPLLSYIILRKHAHLFLENVGSDFPEKLKAIQGIVDYNNRDDVHAKRSSSETLSRREDIDVVPGIGINISKAAWPLKLPGYSRLYKRHEKKKFTGKETLRKYVDLFEENGAEGPDMEILKTAVNADVVWDEIISLEILDDPKTLLYDLGVTGNHTFMMQSGIFTHNTLNSVSWDTEIDIGNKTAEALTTVKIGKWIDDLMSSNTNIVTLENGTEYLEIKQGTVIPTVDADGHFSFGDVTAVTRHPPRGDLVKITTLLGASVIATRTKSLLIWNKEKKQFLHTPGADAKIGDFVPNCNNLENKNAIWPWNSVFMDPIISIEHISEIDHPKVYDLTIPSTTNFCLSNGMGVADSFHSTGMSAKDVTLGVPRLKEVLNATKKPSKPTCTIFLNERELKMYESQYLETKDEKINGKALEKVTEIANSFTSRTVEYFMKDYELQYLLPDGGDRDAIASPIKLKTYKEYDRRWWVALSEDFGNVPLLEPEAWVILLNFDVGKLFTYGITPKDIAKSIEQASLGNRGHTMACVASPSNLGQVEIYLNFAEIRQLTSAKFGNEEKTLITEDNIDYFTTREVAIELIKKTKVQGISGITKTYVRQEPKTKEWIIDTQGTSLSEILSRPGVDQTRTISDDIWEVYFTFGIEAVRKFLIEEITRILSFDGTYINPRHISLLVDTMCRTGTITSVNRDGISREVGPIAKGMFEKAVDNFAEAAAFGEYDKMKGVSAAVMYGTLPEVGTGTVIIKDADRLPVVRKHFGGSISDLSEAKGDSIMGKSDKGKSKK